MRKSKREIRSIDQAVSIFMFQLDAFFAKRIKGWVPMMTGLVFEIHEGYCHGCIATVSHIGSADSDYIRIMFDKWTSKMEWRPDVLWVSDEHSIEDIRSIGLQFVEYNMGEIVLKPSSSKNDPEKEKSKQFCQRILTATTPVS